MALFHVLSHNDFLYKMRQGHTAVLAQTLDRRQLKTEGQNRACIKRPRITIETSNAI